MVGFDERIQRALEGASNPPRRDILIDISRLENDPDLCKIYIKVYAMKKSGVPSMDQVQLRKITGYDSTTKSRFDYLIKKLITLKTLRPVKRGRQSLLIFAQLPHFKEELTEAALDTIEKNDEEPQ